MPPFQLKPIPFFTFLRFSALSASCVLAGLHGPALAQSADGVNNAAAVQNLPTVTVTAPGAEGYKAEELSTATRTDTPLIDVPQSVTVVTQQLIEDQNIQSMADVVRYVPGVGMEQGEGHRDAPVFRGNTSTSDFFIDGIRDDAQYFRDVYNIERVEVLKGPNGMIFGRGGSGGVINRVSKDANWDPLREFTVEAGSDNHKRLTTDINQPLNDAIAFRLNALYQDSESFRNGVQVERKGVNPTVTIKPDNRTKITLGAEYFEDERVTDRGVPSFQGRPVAVDVSTFFGNQELSPADATVKALNASLEHKFDNGMTIRNRTRYAEYDKFYQNVFASGAATADGTVPVDAYNSATDRENLFNQTDLLFSVDTGAIKHKLLTGVELGRQETDNLKRFAIFAEASPTVTLSDPIYRGAIDFQSRTPSNDNSGTAKTAAIYVQDQIEFSPQWEAIVGLRYDRFDIDFQNNLDGTVITTEDNLLSPRAGLIYKPQQNVSVYASYSMTYVPRAGEQLSSLSLTNQALDPEEFESAEVGVKWNVRPDLALTAAVYQLDQSNVAVKDPANPTTLILEDGQRTRGAELEVAGQVTNAWSVMGGYAYQNAEIQGSGSQAGATVGQVPKHSFALWNRYDFTPTWGAAVGVTSRSHVFATTSNRVRLPGFARVDAAVFYKINENFRAQLNVENVLDREYYASAHNDNNISPGSPRAVRLSLTGSF
jgi:catecholate siderophore receptor